MTDSYLDHLKPREAIDLDPPPYGASVLADSITAGVRLTTLVVKIPRFELPAFNTHRMFSRNSASSRAIPVHKRIAQVREDPFVPLVFGKNRSGMQSDEEVTDARAAEAEWLKACNGAIERAEALVEIGVHKQLANRLLEPYAWQTIIVSATEWDNWDALRVSRHAQGEIALAARNILAAREASTPVELKLGEWHLPLVFKEDVEGSGDRPEYLAQIAAGRCARVSYLTHDGKRDLEADIRLYRQLRERVHMSPLEHPAMVCRTQMFRGERLGDFRVVPFVSAPAEPDVAFIGDFEFIGEFIGNFRAPWVQLRKMIPGESVAPKDGAI